MGDVLTSPRCSDKAGHLLTEGLAALHVPSDVAALVGLTARVRGPKPGEGQGGDVRLLLWT